MLNAVVCVEVAGNWVCVEVGVQNKNVSGYTIHLSAVLFQHPVTNPILL